MEWRLSLTARKEQFTVGKIELDRNLNKLLDIIIESVLVAFTKEDLAKVSLWPIPTPQGVLYWAKEWSKKLNHVLCLIDKQNVSRLKVKEALKYPSRLVHILWRIDALQRSDLNREERLYVVRKLFGYLADFRKKDLWCEDGKNILWNFKELRGNKRGLVFFLTKDERRRKLFFNLEASLFLYTELIYWANHPLGHCFHGLYGNEKGIVLVKEYFDLKPEVWDFSKNLSFSQVEIFEVYKKGTKIKLEFFERGIRTTESFKQNLLSFALKVDEKVVNQAEDISKYLENLQDVIKKGGKFVQSLNKKQLIEKHAQYWFYAIKPLCDLVGEDWHPPQAVRDNIYKKYRKIDTIWQNEVKRSFEKMSVLPPKQQERALRDYFDPRS